jgi:HlyD family secretion protein
VPLTALFRNGDSWAVFIVDGGRARLRNIEIGRRNNTAAEVVTGLDAGNQVILHPSDRIRDGVRISSRGE